MSLPGTLKLGIKQKRKRPSLQTLHQDLTSFQSKIHTPTSDRALTTTRNFQLGTARVSTLISASVVLESGSPTPGRLYVAVFIEDEDRIIQATLFKGYVYAQHPVDGNGALVIREGDRLRIESKSSLVGITLRVRGRQLRNQIIPGGWTGVSEGILEGPGFIRNIGLTNPAVGVSSTAETCPTGARWKVKGALFVLVTGPTAGNRLARFDTTDGTNFTSLTVSAILQTADQVRSYFFTPGLGALYLTLIALNTVEPVPMGDNVIMTAGHIARLQVSLQNRADDDIGDSFLYVEEWLEP